MSSKNLYACLPFVEFTRREGIAMGPIHFWPSSEAESNLREDFSTKFKNYLKKANKEFTSRPIACISIDETIPEERKEPLLIDGIYLLYFASNFRNVYYSNEILKLSSFTKILPANEEIVQNKNIAIGEQSREKIACISWIDEEIANALGKALSNVYEPNGDRSNFDESIRLVRAIRFFVDRFFSKFENLLTVGLELPPNLFEPEDILFLASSYDVLLTIDDKQASSDFRQKIRPMLHLKFSKPVELFWKWVDEFYTLKKQVAQGAAKVDHQFTANPNFSVPLMHIGLKLFIYVLYYQLYQYHFIPNTTKDKFSPPDFRWIHPEEVLLFFWTEESLLRKISLLLMQIREGKLSAENQSDIHLLSTLFVSLMEKFYSQSPSRYIQYLPSPEGVLDPFITPILNYGLIATEYLHPEFLTWLKKRSGIG